MKRRRSGNLGQQYATALDRVALTEARMRRAFKAWEREALALRRLGALLDRAMSDKP